MPQEIRRPGANLTIPPLRKSTEPFNPPTAIQTKPDGTQVRIDTQTRKVLAVIPRKPKWIIE